MTGDDARVFNGSSVFIATGLLETARIVVNSTRTKNGSVRPLCIQTSDIFTVPVNEGHPLWESNAFLPKSMAPQARQGSIRSLADLLLERAREWRAKQTDEE